MSGIILGLEDTALNNTKSVPQGAYVIVDRQITSKKIF